MEKIKDYNSDVVERIKHIRMMKNISQSNVAKALNITTTAYSRIENSKTQLTINNLYIISEFLEIPLQELLNIKVGYSAFNHNNVVMTNFNHVTLNLSIDLKELDNIMKKHSNNK